MKIALIILLLSVVIVLFFMLLPKDEAHVIFMWDKSDAKLKSDNREFLHRLAKTVDDIEINNCKLSPPILKAFGGKKVTVKNNDERDNVIETDIEHSFLIPKNSELEIVLDLGHGNGIYGVSCNGSEKLAGIIILEN